MRLLVAAVLLLSAGLCLGFTARAKGPSADDKSAARAERLKELKKKFDEEFDELGERFKKAKDDSERNGIRTEAKELAALTSDKVMKLVEDDPKDATAFDAAEFVVQQLQIGGAGPGLEKALAVVAEHHLGNPRVKGLLMTAGRHGPAGQKFLEAVAEKSDNKEVKGLALFYLGSALAQQADNARDEKEAAEVGDKAIDYLLRAAKEAPEARVGRETMAKAVEAAVAEIKLLRIGAPAPDVEGTDLDGHRVKLSSFKGKVVLLDIWATWCPPCRGMIPHERELVKRMNEGKKPFVLLSVSADEKKEDLTKFLEKEPMPWNHWFDGEDGVVIKKYKVRAFPTLYLIDAKGVIRKKWIGAPANDVIDKAVEEAVKDAQTNSGQ